MEGEATKLDPSSESDLESSVSAPAQETAAQDNAASEQIDQHYFEIDPRTLSYRSSSDPNTSSTRSSISDTRIGSVASNRPHKAHDIGWEAIRTVRSRDGTIGLGHFRFLQRLGSGDIGSVYLSELRGTSCYFAMKVMDKRALASRNKLARAQTEKEILEVLDHPFLPTLYAHIDERQFSCLVTEFCPGGDLHVLRQQQPCKRFRDSAARFYAAEVLLAMEYLHMMGIVYRDLKPENVLVREDGHIMLTDFDLSLKCSFNPTLTRLTCTAIASPQASYCSPSKDSSCIQPLGCVSPCSVHPIASCLPISMPRLLHMSSSRRKSKHRPHDGRSSGGTAAGSLPELVVEPTSVRSMSFVGTHEYLAPEIILGEGHGSAVDWWTFGIFLFELLYGKTPFRGADNEVTLMNAITQPLQFPPDDDEVCSAAQDLIRGLLVKDPQKRLAAVRGASEIKQHAFFHGVNWALIRCAIPPEIPSPFRVPDVEGSKAEPPPTDSTIDEKKKTWIVEGNPSDSLPDFELF